MTRYSMYYNQSICLPPFMHEFHGRFLYMLKAVSTPAVRWLPRGPGAFCLRPCFFCSAPIVARIPTTRQPGLSCARAPTTSVLAHCRPLGLTTSSLAQNLSDSLTLPFAFLATPRSYLSVCVSSAFCFRHRSWTCLGRHLASHRSTSPTPITV